MDKIKDFTDRNHKIIIIIFFSIFLIIGILSVKDYGITWDENSQKNLGISAIKLLLRNDRSIYGHINKYHGTTFTLILTIIERIFNINNTSTVFILRHYATFILFYTSVIFFYFLCRNIFKSWKLGLLGSVFLVLSPRIFADSFYNPKDLPFLSLFIIAIFTLYRFLQKRSASYAFLHGIVTGIATGLRIISILIFVFTILFFILDLLILKKQTNNSIYIKTNRQIMILLIYLFVTIIVFLALMPALLPDPLNNFIAALKTMSDFPLDTRFLYMGQYLSSFDLPWHYLPVNILLMTPIPYSILFFIGLLYFFSHFRKGLIDYYLENKFIIISIMWFFIPVLAVIILGSTLYNGWRQMYFIYPALLILALNGVKFMYRLLFTKLKIKYYNLAAMILAAAIIMNQVYITQLMVRQHPYQYIYYNILAGRDMKVVKGRFILDYWGMAYKDALEFILKTDNRKRITYTTREGSNEAAEYMFSEQDKERLVFVNTLEETEYLIINHRFEEDEYLNPKNKVYSVLVNGGEISTVYRLRYYPYYLK